MNGTMNSCVECDEVITNPICSECLAQRMQVMVRECDPSLTQEIRGIQIDGTTRCLFCGKGMALCAHCFTKDIYDFLQGRDAVLAEEFASRFDFDLRQELL